LWWLPFDAATGNANLRKCSHLILCAHVRRLAALRRRMAEFVK
jgi:hypothetical protein